MSITYNTQAGILILTIENKKIVDARLNDITLPLNLLNTPHFSNLAISDYLEDNSVYIVDANTIDGAPFTQAVRSLKSYFEAQIQAILHVENYEELRLFLPKDVIEKHFSETNSQQVLKHQITSFLAHERGNLCHL